MPKGAIHFTGTNFAIRRRLRWDILDRMRKLIANGTYSRPRWMDWVESYPPLDTRNLLHKDYVVKNPYMPLITTLLKKYPDLRFQGCLDPDNEWDRGMLFNYNSILGKYQFSHDHPIMQFVTYQLSLMNKGVDKEEAFKMTEEVFYKKRMEEENKIKVEMALGLDEDASPRYTTGLAYKTEKEHQERVQLLSHIRDELRKIKTEVLESKDKKEEKQTLKRK